ncbi:hypothetical protein GE09DRAFT_1088331 [Coniochaeta sp. 2T2.1]|nr:hypothetical protein GE09DRAFT_1088331 [Coniochaeta sp. 2T2.1]
MATTEHLASIRQAIEHTLHEFLMSYEDAAAQQDAAIISRSLAPDCVRHLGPKSLLRKLGLPTDIVFTNEQYRGLFAKESAAAAVKRSEISNVCVDAVARRASATTTYHGGFSDGEKHSLEFSWFLSVGFTRVYT